ncbi:hypothetical protein ACFQ7O_35685 [Streptomyces sp. NPDC056485]|uniref:hypothetical protein n=1 Tax=Streptomyces sp. NPDC056485 TaxID=3345834 RepID=UPI0036C0E54C
MTYYPAAYAERCEAEGRPVPADVAARLAEPDDPADWRPGWAVLGVDLGKRTDHSAFALLVPAPVGWRFPSVTRMPLASGAGERHYLTQSKRVAAAAAKVLADVGPVTILVDATGVGEAVIEMVAEALPVDSRVRLVSVVLTGGRGANHREDRWTVSKTALVDPMVAALEQGELTFGPFNDRDVVRRELLAYRVKASSVEAGADRLEAERQSDHDDTVVACAMAVYAARRPSGIRVLNPVHALPRPGTRAGLYSRPPKS